MRREFTEVEGVVLSGEKGTNRPHMVMMVGNHVVGDSRVEKSAASAVKAGYRVTVLGSRHRSVFPIGRLGDIPIYRVPHPFRRQLAWNEIHVEEERNAESLDALFGAVTEQERRDLDQAVADYLAGRGRLTRRIAWFRPMARALSRIASRLRVEQAVHAVVEGVRREAAKLRAVSPGGWRKVWPQIADYEESFLRALVDLKPDIIHAHDRHPIAAAAAYAARMHAKGFRVPWVYDAHEWLPGQHMSGPEEHRIGWLAAEAELIQRADAVITVSPTLAHRMKRRHALRELPAVVVNAPLAQKVPMDPAVRRPLREECGLGPDVPLLAYVGKLAEGRGIYTMLEALPELPGVHVAYVASKDVLIREELKRQAADLGVSERIHIVDYVPAVSVTWFVESATIGMSPLYPTSAHHSAMPTKIREYLQAGLPVVASDLRAQGDFIRQYRVGALHEPKDASSLAGAVREVLAKLDDYRRAIAPELLLEHTWEGEERVLTRLWHGLVQPAEPDEQGGAAAPVAAAAVSRDAGPALAVTEAMLNPLAASWATFVGPVIDLGEASADPPLGAALERGVLLDRDADVVLFTGVQPLLGKHLGGPIVEARTLEAAGKAVGVFAGDLSLISGEQALKRNPRHPARDWDPEFLARHARQVRRATSVLRDLQVPVFTTSLFGAQQFPSAHWCPLPVRVDSALPPDSPEPRVLVVPLARSHAEEAALTELETALRDLGVTLARPRRRGFDHASGADADIVIDSLALEEYSKAGAWAFGAGRILIGDTAAGAPEAPVVEASAETLVEVVVELVRDRGSAAWHEKRYSSLEYGHSHHDGRRAVDAIRVMLAL